MIGPGIDLGATMPDLIESARSILVSSERRAQSSAQDIANSSTPGYKQQASFAQILGTDNRQDLPETRFVGQFTQGQLAHTGGELDLALVGPGLFQVRDGESLVYTRGGGFVRGPAGVLADAQGRVLQQAGGGDLVVGDGAIEFLSDGAVLSDELPTGQVGVFEIDEPAAIEALGGSLYRAPPGEMMQATRSSLRQGYLESSNVVLSDELVSLMTASRQAESGARIAQVYDQLIGQAITTFGRGAQ